MPWRRYGSVAADAGGVAAHDAYVVEHGGLFNKLSVGAQLGMCVDDLQGAACHVAAVAHEDVVEVGAGRVIFLYYLVVIHRLF